VKGIFGRDEFAAARRPVGEFDRALGRFGAGIHEEAARDAFGRDCGEALAKLGLGLGIEDVGGLHQPTRLAGNRLDERRVAMADARHSPAGHQVDEFPTFDVAHARAAPFAQRHGMALDHGQELSGFELLDGVELHGSSSGNLGYSPPR